jgi:hypothetical protein
MVRIPWNNNAYYATHAAMIGAVRAGINVIRSLSLYLPGRQFHRRFRRFRQGVYIRLNIGRQHVPRSFGHHGRIQGHRRFPCVGLRKGAFCVQPFTGHPFRMGFHGFSRMRYCSYPNHGFSRNRPDGMPADCRRIRHEPIDQIAPCHCPRGHRRRC